MVDDAVADPHDAAGDLLEPRDHAQRRRLATPGRPDEDDELPVGDPKVEAVDRRRTVRVGLRNAFERDSSH